MHSLFIIYIWNFESKPLYAIKYTTYGRIRKNINLKVYFSSWLQKNYVRNFIFISTCWASFKLIHPTRWWSWAFSAVVTVLRNMTSKIFFSYLVLRFFFLSLLSLLFGDFLIFMFSAARTEKISEVIYKIV